MIRIRYHFLKFLADFLLHILMLLGQYGDHLPGEMSSPNTLVRQTGIQPVKRIDFASGESIVDSVHILYHPLDPSLHPLGTCLLGILFSQQEVIEHHGHQLMYAQEGFCREPFVLGVFASSRSGCSYLRRRPKKLPFRHEPQPDLSFLDMIVRSGLGDIGLVAGLEVVQIPHQTLPFFGSMLLGEILYSAEAVQVARQMAVFRLLADVLLVYGEVVGAQIYMEAEGSEDFLQIEVSQGEVGEAILMPDQRVFEGVFFRTVRIVLIGQNIDGYSETRSILFAKTIVQRLGAANQFVQHIEQHPVVRAQALQFELRQGDPAPAEDLIGHLLVGFGAALEASDLLLHPDGIPFFKKEGDEKQQSGFRDFLLSIDKMVLEEGIVVIAVLIFLAFPDKVVEVAVRIDLVVVLVISFHPLHTHIEDVVQSLKHVSIEQGQFRRFGMSIVGVVIPEILELLQKVEQDALQIVQGERVGLQFFLFFFCEFFLLGGFVSGRLAFEEFLAVCGSFQKGEMLQDQTSQPSFPLQIVVEVFPLALEEEYILIVGYIGLAVGELPVDVGEGNIGVVTCQIEESCPEMFVLQRVVGTVVRSLVLFCHILK